MTEHNERMLSPFSAMEQREAAFLLEHLPELLDGRPVIQGITIDGPTSHELDDALWLEQRTDGRTWLDISIADVAALLTPKQSPALDAAAFERAFTRYGVHDTIPMLPHLLSEEGLSLLEGQPRPTITLSIPVDAQGQPGVPTIRRTMLTSAHRFTYEQVDA